MTDAGTSSGEDAALTLFSITPPEDSGADTQSRYWFQTQVIARSCVVMLTRPEIVAVLCEWWEDFVEIHADGTLVLVSCKHREPELGPWSLADLCGNGGLAHLFDRWLACDSVARVRIATNAGLKTGTGNASELKRLCEQQPNDLTIDTPLVKIVAERFLLLNKRGTFQHIPCVSSDKTPNDILRALAEPDGYLDQVARFLGLLQFDESLPRRDHIRSVNINELMAPALQNLQRDARDAGKCYDAITEIVSSACRDNDGAPIDMARYLSDPLRGTMGHVVSSSIERRMVTPTVVRTAALAADGHELTLLPPSLDATVDVAGGHVLAEKMRAGGISAAGISAARRLRQAWQLVWAARRTDLPGDAATLYELEISVLDAVDLYIMSAKSRGEQWGIELDAALKNRLQPEHVMKGQARLPFSQKHLRGLAYDLCDQCEFAFSDAFTTQGDVS